MVKLYIVAEGCKINIELDSVDISLDEFKKIIEKNMTPGKVIPHNEQSVFIDKSKLEGDKKLGDFIKDPSKEVKVFVLRQSGGVLGSGSKSSSHQPKPEGTHNPYSNPQIKKNPYEATPNTMQVPNWGYPPQQSFGQPPGFGYGSPGQGFSQMPPMNNIISKEQIDLLLSNPQFIEQIVDLQNPGLAKAEKDNRVNMYLECFKSLKNDPNLMNSLNNMAPDLLRNTGMPGFNQPPTSPYGYPLQYPMPPQHGFPPQPNYNPYFQQQPYYGYPPQYPVPPYGSPQQPPMSPSHYEGAYAPQLKALEEMGFTDKKENLDALIKSNGDINAALDYLRKDENFKQN